MRYEKIKNRTDKDFKRLTGVSHPIFKRMVAILNQEIRNFGRPPTLSRADRPKTSEATISRKIDCKLRGITK